uniref:B30.2/SPRY domain-containing protein n=1 Tax=Stegastes partitus TaxID=144197 RepID=A0A3B4ZLI4_9TELE
MRMWFLQLSIYACELTLDPNTAHRNLELSDSNRKVTLRTDEQPYPDRPERFDFRKQLLCTGGLSTAGRFYWEVEREGVVHVAVTYERIQRKGQFDDSCLGRNDQSWSLRCADDGYSVRHNNKRTSIYVPSSSRVGVYLDWPAGTLSFYKVSSDKLTHLHTLNTKFTEPLFPAFRIKPGQLKASVSLCQV